jgi:hypothetical protein
VVENTCDPWRGPREWFQHEARKVLHVDRHLWITNTCRNSPCLNGTHLATLRPEPLDYLPGVCVYCGLPASTKDHLIPWGWSGDAARSYVLTVPACHQCNEYIGDVWAPTITERRRIAQQRIRSRNRRALRVHRFTQAELDEMGPNLRSSVDAGTELAELVRARLDWPGNSLYDFGACARAGFADPYDAGLLLPEGDPMTTCPRCLAAWGGSRPAHCGSCHLTFSGLELFDAHRDHHGDHGRCVPPDTVLDSHGRRRMFLRDGVWRGPEMTTEAKARVQGKAQR